MEKKKRHLKGEEGFTLIEIIAVLIVLGVLAAVAVPRYMAVTDDAREKAAQAAIAETKARLSTAYASSFIKKASDPTITEVLANTNTTAGSWGPDFTVTVGNSDPVLITVTAVQGVNVTNATGYWNLPVME